MELKQKKYDLLGRRKTLLDEAKAFLLAGKADEHAAKLAEAQALDPQIEAIDQLIAADEKSFGQTPEDLWGLLGAAAAKVPGAGGETKDAVKAFAAAARNGFVVKDLSEGSMEDGGYVVPEDIVTQVETLKQSKFSLKDLVGVETVSTNKGRRTMKKRSQQVGFTKVGEGGKIPKGSSPKFSVLEYDISKYAGFLPVTNELLDDSDANITQELTAWIADEGRVTDNTLIRAAINKKATVDLTDLDGIKNALMVTLDGAFLATSKIITNQNGLFWLATRKDAMERDLLSPIPSEPGKMQLAMGAMVVPVVALPNADLPSNGTKAPFILGDLVEGIRYFDRKMLTINTSDVAVAGDFNAFEQDMTLTRAIQRCDVQQRDGEAYVNGFIDTTPPAV